MRPENNFARWADFKRHFAEDLSSAGRLIETFAFRGQADSRWNICSAFDRACSSEIQDRTAYYRKMLGFFSYQVRQYGEDFDGMKAADKAAIAQHYGMPTRLIDWTKSPYVAAFMAFSAAIIENRMSDGARVAIWALNLIEYENAVAASPEAPCFSKVETRRLENDRVWRQAGLFIEATSAEVDFTSYVEKLEGAAAAVILRKFTIPAREAQAALNDLILMGLTPASLYPDRDGAAKYVQLRMALDRHSE
ncbi:MAG: FRG domain-containing protein [Parvularculaceae bacterium]|nr:FRG domain-containing protein [Parvularculaceae bacterium]